MMRFVTASEMQQIDEKAIRDYGIPSLILMENAGRACAEEARRFILSAPNSQIAIFTGKGNNGGDGFVAARHFYNYNLNPVIFYFQKPSQMKPDPLTNFKILERMKVRLVDCSENIDWANVKKITQNSKLIIDSLFGTGLSKLIEEPFRTAIEIMNESKVSILAVDIPSGLNADTGEVMGVCVEAEMTVALALPKKAFMLASVKRYTGKVIIADISIPRELLT